LEREQFINDQFSFILNFYNLTTFDFIIGALKWSLSWNNPQSIRMKILKKMILKWVNFRNTFKVMLRNKKMMRMLKTSKVIRRRRQSRKKMNHQLQDWVKSTKLSKIFIITLQSFFLNLTLMKKNSIIWLS